MTYEKIASIRDNYNQALRFISDLKYNVLEILNNLEHDTIELTLNKEDFKSLYNEIKNSPYKRKKLLIVHGIMPLYVQYSRAAFHYKSGNIFYVFTRRHSYSMKTITNERTKHNDVQEILNM